MPNQAAACGPGGARPCFALCLLSAKKTPPPLRPHSSKEANSRPRSNCAGDSRSSAIMTRPASTPGLSQAGCLSPRSGCPKKPPNQSAPEKRPNDRRRGLVMHGVAASYPSQGINFQRWIFQNRLVCCRPTIPVQLARRLRSPASRLSQVSPCTCSDGFYPQLAPGHTPRRFPHRPRLSPPQ